MSSPKWKILVILLIAAGLRVIGANVIDDAHVPWDYEYEEIARNLAFEGEYNYSFYGLSESRPTSFQPPIYPFFLAALLKVSPSGFGVLAPTQILLSVLSIWALYRLTLAAGGSEGQGLLGALMLAVYPPLILYTVIPSPVTLETLFLITGTWFTLRARQSSPAGWSLAAGASLALAGLTRSPWLLTIPIAILWTFWQGNRSGWRRLQTPLLLGFAAILVLLPWARHNAQVHDAWFVNGTNGGLNFWIGNNPLATGEYTFPTQIDRELLLQTVGWEERARDRFFYQQGMDYIRSQPVPALKLAFKKLAYFVFFRPTIGSNYQGVDLQTGIATQLFVAAWLLLLPLGLAGLWVDRHRWRDHMLLAGIILSQAAVTMLYFAGTRFRTPLDPFFMLWAAGFLVWLLQRWRARREEPLSHA